MMDRFSARKNHILANSLHLSTWRCSCQHFARGFTKEIAINRREGCLFVSRGVFIVSVTVLVATPCKISQILIFVVVKLPLNALVG